MWQINLVDPQVLKVDKPQSDIAATEYVSLCHRGFARVALGSLKEEYRILVRQGSSWQAVRLEKNRLSANFQGSPLWPALALAQFKNLQNYFGLDGASSKSVCLIPTPSTINQKLAGLLAPLAFRFSEKMPICEKEYVDNFIDQGILPMAPIDDRDSVHDWSYHFVTFLFPEYMENVRQTLLFIRGNLSLFQGSVVRGWNFYGHSHDANGNMKGEAIPEQLYYQDAIYRQMAISLDVATAKIVQLLCLREKGLIGRCRSELDYIGCFFARVSRSSVHRMLFMESNLDSLFQRLPAPEPLQCDVLNCIDENLRQLDQKAGKQMDLQAIQMRQSYFLQILSQVNCEI